MRRWLTSAMLLVVGCAGGSDGLSDSTNVLVDSDAEAGPISASNVLFETSSGRHYLCDEKARSLCNVGLTSFWC